MATNPSIFGASFTTSPVDVLSSPVSPPVVATGISPELELVAPLVLPPVGSSPAVVPATSPPVVWPPVDCD